MSKTYAIGDIHGRNDLLRAAFSEIIRHASKEPCKIVTLGNYIDFGPDSDGVIDLLRLGTDHKIWRNIEFVCLMGSSEKLLLLSLDNSEIRRLWIGHGGKFTIMSYATKRDYKREHHVIRRSTKDISAIKSADIEWIKRLPLFYEDKHRIYVHAGLDFNKWSKNADGKPVRKIEEQVEDDLLWKIYQGGHDIYFTGDKHVVHGHRPFRDGPALYHSRTSLNTHAWSTGLLTVGVFDDDTPGGPVELIEIKGDPDPRYADSFADCWWEDHPHQELKKMEAA